MSSEQSQELHYIYQIPTRLNVEDQLIVLGPFSLTLRQTFVLTIGACLAVNVWRMGEGLTDWHEIGLTLRLIMTALPPLLALIWAYLRLADRYLEDWTLVIMRYMSLPKDYRWQSVCQQADQYRKIVARQKASQEEQPEDIL